MANRKIRIVLERRTGGISKNYRIIQLQNAITVNTLEAEYVVGSYVNEQEAEALVELGEYEIIVKINKI